MSAPHQRSLRARSWGSGWVAAGLVLEIFGACGPKLRDEGGERSTGDEPAGAGEVVLGMVKVPRGTFIRGCDAGEKLCASGEKALLDSSPRMEVTLSEYYIDRYEVTMAEYQECVAVNRCTPGAYAPEEVQRVPRNPVYGVTWGQARDYCAWLGKRLPTEAEWEKAARGTKGQVFAWGNEGPRCGQALVNIKECPTSQDVSSAVDAHPDDVSPYGVVGMMGNVQEWTGDGVYKHYRQDELVDPVGPSWELDPEAGPLMRDKIVRGSYYDSQAWPTWMRSFALPEQGHARIGFRCVSRERPNELKRLEPLPPPQPPQPMAPPRPGEVPPGSRTDGEPCAADVECEVDTYCVDTRCWRSPCSDFRCTPHARIEIGDACLADVPCYADFGGVKCIAGHCGDWGRCQAGSASCRECLDCVEGIFRATTPPLDLVLYGFRASYEDAHMACEFHPSCLEIRTCVFGCDRTEAEPSLACAVACIEAGADEEARALARALYVDTYLEACFADPDCEAILQCGKGCTKESWGDCWASCYDRAKTPEGRELAVRASDRLRRGCWSICP